MTINKQALKPGKYAILFRNNWDGEGDTYDMLAILDDELVWRDEDGKELLEYERDAVLKAWPMNDGSNVLALLDELEAKDKTINFLKDQLEQLANFNPDWDKLEAATDSLREHMSELTAARARIAELERGGKVIKCWSCQKSVTIGQVTVADGYCPSCNCGIDLEDYETAELVAAGIITKVGE